MKNRQMILRILVVGGILLGLLSQVFYPVIETVSAQDGIKIPILMYHHVSDRSIYWGKDAISTEEFANDLQTLHRLGFHTVTPSQVIAYVEGKDILPPKPIMLTFDDGFLSFKTKVVPLLEQYNYCAAVAIVGAYAQKASETDSRNDNFDYLTWEDLAGFDPRTVEVIYHSYDMHNVGGSNRTGIKNRRGENEESYLALIQEDMTRMAELLGAVGGNCRTVAYPYGAYSDLSEQALKAAGAKMTLTCAAKINTVRQGEMDSLFLLGRINRPHGVNSEYFIRTKIEDKLI